MGDRNATSYTDPDLRRGREGRPYRRWRAEVLRDPAPGVPPTCWRCLLPIDKTLPPNHPMSATADHWPPLTRITNHRAVLDPRNGRPAHRRCNLEAGNSMALPAPQSQSVTNHVW